MFCSDRKILMKKGDQAIEHYHILNPHPLPFTCLVRLDMRLYQPLEENEKDQLIELWLGRQGKISDPQRLRLILYGAQFAKPRLLYPGMNLYIDIISIRDRQWSGLHYILMDLEDTSELLYCRSFEAKIEGFYLDSQI